MYTETLVAQISDGKLQLGGLFDSLKVNVDKYKEVIDNFAELDLNKEIFKDLETGMYDWEAITEAIGDVDDKALSYFKTLEDGNGVIDNQSASIETKLFQVFVWRQTDRTKQRECKELPKRKSS